MQVVLSWSPCLAQGLPRHHFRHHQGMSWRESLDGLMSESADPVKAAGSPQHARTLRISQTQGLSEGWQVYFPCLWTRTIPWALPAHVPRPQADSGKYSWITCHEPGRHRQAIPTQRRPGGWWSQAVPGMSEEETPSWRMQRLPAWAGLPGGGCAVSHGAVQLLSA